MTKEGVHTSYKTGSGINLYMVFIALFTVSLAVTIWNVLREEKLRKLTMKNEQLRAELYSAKKEDILNGV